MSNDSTPGTSSCCYSTSSSSSSAENISTVENGELSVISFLMPTHRLDISPDMDSYVHLPSCTCSYSSKESNSSFSLDSYVMDDQSSMYGKKRRQRECQNHLLDSGNILLPADDDGLLLRSMEKGVLFPIIHWSSKCNESLMRQTQLGSTMVFCRGIYRELKCVIPPDVWLRKAVSGSPRKAWLILGYKSLEKTLDSVLYNTWKDWTGVRQIYLNLRNDFEIKKISFYNRVHPQDNLDLFMYLVLIELGNVDNRNNMWLLDFVQRTRVERMKGFLTVYTQMEPEIPSVVEDEYLKYFPTQTYKMSPAKSLTGVDNAADSNGTVKFIEKLLQEINSPATNEYYNYNGT